MKQSNYPFSVRSALARPLNIRSLCAHLDNCANRRADAERMGWEALAQSWASDEERLIAKLREAGAHSQLLARGLA